MDSSRDQQAVLDGGGGAVPCGVLAINLAGYVVMANHGIHQMLGYQDGQLVGLHISQLSTDEQWVHVLAGEVAGQSADVPLLTTMRRMTGDAIRLQVLVQRLQQQEQLAVLVVTELVSDLFSDQIFRVAVEYSPSGMLVVDESGSIVLANLEALRLFGYAREELIGQSVDVLVPQGQRHMHVNLRRHFIAKPESRLMGSGRDLSGLRKDGTTFPLEIGLRPVMNGGRICVIASVTDASARKAAEELREQVVLTKSRLAAIVESSQDAMISKDLFGVITSWNEGAQKLFGYAAAEMVGFPIDLLVPEGLHSEELEMRRIVVADNESVPPRDTVRRARSGAMVNVSVSMSPIRDQSGNVVGVSQVLRDITERIKIEKEMALRTAQLERSNSELQQFAHSASHDLQEPLRAVYSCVELLQRRYKDRIDDRANEYIRFSMDSVRRMRQMIDGMLSLAKIDGELRNTSSVDCNHVLQDVVANLQQAIRKSKAKVIVGRLPELSGDVVQLRQLFQNLIGNAIKFCSAATPVVNIDCERDGESYVFCVADNGIGIPEEYRQQIFGLFRRLNSVERYQGTGIGLALCAKIVASHRGAIWVESNADQGSKFYVRLPVNNEPSP